MAPDPKHVARYHKLHEMQEKEQDPYRKAAIQRKKQALPPEVHAAAKAQGPKNMAPMDVLDEQTNPQKAQTDALTQQGIAQQAVKDEVDRWIVAVTQGHHQGYSQFRDWYRGYKKAQEESISKDLAAGLFEFLLEVGVDIIFPELGEMAEEAAKLGMNMMKAAVKSGLKSTFDALTKSMEKEDLEKFLDKVMIEEEKTITGLLDVRDAFMKTPGADKAVDSFVMARLDPDKPWAHTDSLPPQTLDILHNSGIGGHGSGEVKTVAERVLDAHIRAVLETEFAPDENFGMLPKGDVEKMAAAQTLKETGGADNLELAWEIEQELPEEYRTICDINHVDAMQLHIRLGMDLDLAQKVIESRHTVGQFGHPHDLVRRELVTEEWFEEAKPKMVARR